MFNLLFPKLLHPFSTTTTTVLAGNGNYTSTSFQERKKNTSEFSKYNS